MPGPVKSQVALGQHNELIKMINEALDHWIKSLATHLILGLPFSFSYVGGDDPLRLLSQSGVGVELQGNTSCNCSI